MRTRASRGGFTTIELLTVMSIIALMAMIFVGSLLMNDDVQIASAKADINMLKSVLQMYYQDMGMYPMGGIVGLVRALSYREAGWGSPRMLEFVRKQALHQYVDGATRYFEVVTESSDGTLTSTVQGVASTASDPAESATRTVRPLMTMVDPWGNEYVYLCAMEYSDPPGQELSKLKYNPKVTGSTGGKAQAAKHSIGGSIESYCNPDSYQIYSFGPDREAVDWKWVSPDKDDIDRNKDNITSWGSL